MKEKVVKNEDYEDKQEIKWFPVKEVNIKVFRGESMKVPIPESGRCCKKSASLELISYIWNLEKQGWFDFMEVVWHLLAVNFECCENKEWISSEHLP